LKYAFIAPGTLPYESPAEPVSGDEIPNLISLAVTPGVAACAGNVLNTIAPVAITAEAKLARFMLLFLIIYFLPKVYPVTLLIITSYGAALLRALDHLV
jgi:hypothetical protein